MRLCRLERGLLALAGARDRREGGGEAGVDAEEKGETALVLLLDRVWIDMIVNFTPRSK